MNIAIIGAAGTVGRQLAHMIVAQRLLECDQRLVLVGNKNGTSVRSMQGMAVDLMDAYAEITPRIDVVMDAEEIDADLIVMAAGKTIPVDFDGEISRDELAKVNLPIFEHYASALAKLANRHSVIIIVSNPNELAVASFARHLGNRRVIGMGAFLDSMRFRKEIAADLGIHRQKIHGFMIGEHGLYMLPLWSSIHIFGYEKDELSSVFQKMRKGHRTASFSADCSAAQEKLIQFIKNNQIQKAYQYSQDFPPDIRTYLKPFVTHMSGAKTAFGTAKATLSLLEMISLGSDSLIAGQITLQGEFHDVHSTIGAPFVIGNKGVDRIINLQLDEEEIQVLNTNSAIIRAKIDRSLSNIEHLKYYE